MPTCTPRTLKISAPFAFLLAALVPFASHASSVIAHPDRVEFFETFEDSWRGTGLHRELQNNGSWLEARYDAEVDVRDLSDTSWNLSSEIRDHNHTIHYGNMDFSVIGDLLYVSSAGPNTPVRILESTPSTLNYCFHRSESFTGRVFEFCHRYEFITANRILGDSSASLNGNRVAEDHFELRRR